MTWKQIETAREIRLWLGQIVIPLTAMTGVVLANPNARRYVCRKARAAKEFVKSKFKREDRSA